jgi:hypothetical protein
MQYNATVKSVPKSNLSAQLPVALGALTYIICGVAISVIASTSLSAEDYVNFVAYTSIGGIVVLGVGSAVEQETNLVFFRCSGRSLATWRFMAPRALWLIAILWVVMLTPVASWQTRLFGNQSSVVQASVVLGVPGLLLAGVGRGIANGRGEFRRLGVAHVIFGLSSLLFPLGLWGFGVSLISALIVGQSMAWAMPSLILFQRKEFSALQEKAVESAEKHLSGWLVLANMALLSNLLSSQLIFRLASITLSANVIAEAQVLITVSCFASTLTLGLMPQIIANRRRQLLSVDNHETLVFVGLLTVGLLLPFTAAVFRRPIASILLPRESTLGFLDALLITSPAFLLVATLLMSGQLIADEKVRLVALLWICGLGGLWGISSIFGGDSLRSLAMALFIGALVAPAVFLLSWLRIAKVHSGKNNGFL